MLRFGWCVTTVCSARFFPSTICRVLIVSFLPLMLTLVVGVWGAMSPAAMAQATASFAAFQADGATASFVATAGGPKYAPGRVILRFRTGVPIAAQATAHSSAGVTLLQRFHAVPGLQVVQLPSGLSVQEALSRYRGDPNIAYAEPDTLLHVLDTVPNDPSFSSLWAMKNTGQSGGMMDADIDATDAWTLSTGSNSVYVGVIDTGVDYNHSDLSGNIYSSSSDCNLNGVDDDGDGYVDNCHGIDTVNHDSDPMDDYDHGSHVSGTIGATGNNAIGVVGINWRVTIIPCKSLDASGSGPASAAIECLDWFATLKDHGLNIVATNNSWGGGESSQAVADAIEAIMQRGILFVVAAGNGGSDGIGDSNDTVPTFPANCALPNVIVVAATDRNDLLGNFSNFGQHTVHVGAPGVSILSTIRANSYATLNGTSMAAPHVTGAAALLKAWDPSLDWREIKNLLLSSAEPIAALSGKTITGGRLNVYSAMSCSNDSLFSPLLPYGNPTVVTGSTISFAALNIVCAQPAGNVTVTIDGAAETVVLHDDGANGDAVANDGIYTGHWIAAIAGWHAYAFQGGSSGTVGVLSPYSVPTSTTYSYRQITGTNLQLLDDGVTSLNLNTLGLFPVEIGGLTFDTISISANGVLSLDNFNSYANSPIPDSSAHVLIAPWWDDLSPQRGTDQNVFYQVTGVVPNRELVIEWRNVPHYEAAPNLTKTVTFQVVFAEGSPSSGILFNYADVNFDETNESAYNAGGSATVGVQIDSAHGALYSYNQPILTNGLALLFETVPGPPLSSLTLISPNGGESWKLGSTQTIQWSYAGSVGTTVKIEVLKAGTLWSTLTASTPVGSGGTGSFSWNIEPALAAASDYQIRITSTSNTAIADISDANFSLIPVPSYVLTVTKVGVGSGTVTGADINCGTDCSGTYPQGTQVALTASEAAGSTFSGWGGACTGIGDCSVVMDAAKIVSATFDPIPSFDFGAPPPSATVIAGQTANFAIVLNGKAGFNGSVSLSCTAGVPPAAACNFNPASANPGNGTATSTLRVSTTARTTAWTHVQVTFGFASLVLPLALLGACRRRSRAAISAASLILAAVMSACGGGAQVNPPPTTGTPRGMYSITVSAISGSITRTQTITLVVN